MEIHILKEISSTIVHEDVVIPLETGLDHEKLFIFR